MKPLSLLLAVALGSATAVLAGPAVIECWFVEDEGGGRLSKKPAALLLRQGPESPPPRPDLDPERYLKVHAVLTVLTHTPTPRIRMGQDALLDLSFAYTPPTPKAATSLAPGPPPFGLEWRRQHLVQPFQEGTYLATVHLPYLQGQTTLELAVQKPPKVALTPAPLIWAAPREAPPELLCLVSHFYPSEGLEVEWELWDGPEGRFQKAEGQRWLSALSHHSDGSLSLSAHLQPPPVTTGQHGARYACRVHHPSLPASGRSAKVTLQVAGLSGPSLEDGVGLFLSAFLLLGLINVLGWAGECKPHPDWDP
eukprot:bmy_14331T0